MVKLVLQNAAGDALGVVEIENFDAWTALINGEEAEYWPGGLRPRGYGAAVDVLASLHRQRWDTTD